MKGILLEGGKVTKAKIGHMKIQDYIEINLKNGDVVLVTASPSGKLKIGKVESGKNKESS